MHVVCDTSHFRVAFRRSWSSWSSAKAGLEDPLASGGTKLIEKSHLEGFWLTETETETDRQRERERERERGVA